MQNTDNLNTCVIRNKIFRCAWNSIFKKDRKCKNAKTTRLSQTETSYIQNCAQLDQWQWAESHKTGQKEDLSSNKRSHQLSKLLRPLSGSPRAAVCSAARPPMLQLRAWLPAAARKLPSPLAVSPPQPPPPSPHINKTYFSLAWLSDGTLLLLPLAYMLAESSDCHAPVNPSQPPWAQPHHHGDTSSVGSNWVPCYLAPPPPHDNHQWVTATIPRP